MLACSPWLRLVSSAVSAARHLAANDRIAWSWPAADWNSAGISPVKVGSATDIPVTTSRSTGERSGHRRTVAPRASAASPGQLVVAQTARSTRAISG